MHKHPGTLGKFCEKQSLSNVWWLDILHRHGSKTLEISIPRREEKPPLLWAKNDMSMPSHWHSNQGVVFLMEKENPWCFWARSMIRNFDKGVLLVLLQLQLIVMPMMTSRYINSIRILTHVSKYSGTDLSERCLNYFLLDITNTSWRLGSVCTSNHSGG